MLTPSNSPTNVTRSLSQSPSRGIGSIGYGLDGVSCSSSTAEGMGKGWRIRAGLGCLGCMGCLVCLGRLARALGNWGSPKSKSSSSISVFRFLPGVLTILAPSFSLAASLAAGRLLVANLTPQSLSKFITNPSGMQEARSALFLSEKFDRICEILGYQLGPPDQTKDRVYLVHRGFIDQKIIDQLARIEVCSRYLPISNQTELWYPRRVPPYNTAEAKINIAIAAAGAAMVWYIYLILTL